MEIYGLNSMASKKLFVHFKCRQANREKTKIELDLEIGLIALPF